MRTARPAHARLRPPGRGCGPHDAASDPPCGGRCPQPHARRPRKPDVGSAIRREKAVPRRKAFCRTHGCVWRGSCCFWPVPAVRRTCLRCGCSRTCGGSARPRPRCCRDPWPEQGRYRRARSRRWPWPHGRPPGGWPRKGKADQRRRRHQGKCRDDGSGRHRRGTCPPRARRPGDGAVPRRGRRAPSARQARARTCGRAPPSCRG